MTLSHLRALVWLTLSGVGIVLRALGLLLLSGLQHGTVVWR